MGTYGMISQTVPDAPKRVPCPSSRVLVDGMSVIESSLASSEAYLMPEIQTKLSALSASSSVYVETGAPDIRHLMTLSCSADDDEEEMSASDRSSSSGSGEDKDSPHLMASLKSSLQHDKSCCEVILAVARDEGLTRQQRIVPSHQAGALQVGRSSWEETFSLASIPVSIIQCIHGGSVEVEILEAPSSITLSDTFSILRPSVLDFSQSLMPEITPRKNRKSSLRRDQRGLTVLAPSPSRYQRPIDSLLISNKNPSPIPTHASALKSKSFQRQHSARSSAFSGHESNSENFNPQSSPLPRQNKIAFTPRTITPHATPKSRY